MGSPAPLLTEPPARPDGSTGTCRRARAADRTTGFQPHQPRPRALKEYYFEQSHLCGATGPDKLSSPSSEAARTPQRHLVTQGIAESYRGNAGLTVPHRAEHRQEPQSRPLLRSGGLQGGFLLVLVYSRRQRGQGPTGILRGERAVNQFGFGAHGPASTLIFLTHAFAIIFKLFHRRPPISDMPAKPA